MGPGDTPFGILSSAGLRIPLLCDLRVVCVPACLDRRALGEESEFPGMAVKRSVDARGFNEFGQALEELSRVVQCRTGIRSVASIISGCNSWFIRGGGVALLNWERPSMFRSSYCVRGRV